MVRWSVILAAGALYAAVLSCVMWTPSAPGQQKTDKTEVHKAPTIGSRDGLPICSVTMQIQRTDWIDKYEHSIDEIAALGADAVKLVVDSRQETVHSTKIFLDMRMTPTPEQLITLIKYAKSKNLRVILMPIVLLENPKDMDWRGKIDPDKNYGGWDDWFDSYRTMLAHFAWIAETSGVDIFIVGSEFISAEPYIDQWTKTIQEVRKTYHGRITYSSNWDHYTSVKFWDQLDLICMNSYWKFAEKDSNPDPSVEQIMARWKKIQDDLLPWVRSTGKPLFFSEIGWFSQRNVAYEPWDYTQEQPIDLELQRKLYEAFFRSWWNNPDLAGFSIWEWPPVEGGPKDNGYTPKGKPAEKELKDWLAKPRWKVN